MESMQYLDLNSNSLDPLKVIRYEKYVKIDDFSDSILSTTGLLSTEKNRFHKYLGFNKFSKKSYPVPSDGWIGTYERIYKDYEQEIEYHKENGYQMDLTFEEFFVRKMDLHKSYVIQHMIDPTAQIFQPLTHHPISELLNKGYKMYKTLDNGGIGFVVMLSSDFKEAEIYGRTKNVIANNQNCGQQYLIFDNLIKKYNPTEIFIGKSELNDMTRFSGGYGDKFDGNSILMKIDEPVSGKFKYVHIGINVFEFTTDEPIVRYVSSVGNNSVPYPYAESQNWCYCMSNNIKTRVHDHPDREKKGEVFDSNDMRTWSMEPATFYVAGRNSDEERFEACVNDDYVDDDFNDEK